MSSKSILNLGVAGAALVAALAVAAPPARAAAIRFCIDKANPMVGVDESVANAVTAQTGITSSVILRDSSKDDQDEDSGNGQEKFFKKLSASCDIIMGFPVEAQMQTVPDGMAASAPYASTGFVAVTTGAPIHAFSTMVQTEQLGVVMLTVASTYFTAQNMAHEHVYYSNEELYSALLRGEVKAALIWQPWLDRELAAHPRDLHVASLNMPHAAWNIVALYPQAPQNPAAAGEFNHGVLALAAAGKLSAAVHPYVAPSSKQ